MNVNKYRSLARKPGWKLCLDEKLEQEDGTTFSMKSYMYTDEKKGVLASRVSFDGGSQVHYAVSTVYSDNGIVEGDAARRIYELIERRMSTS